jgi:Ser/Thr protein kinase RdoA (MazF antagonist)
MTDLRGGLDFQADASASPKARRLAEAALERYGLRNARLELLRWGFVQVFGVVSPSREGFTLRLYGTMPHAAGEEERPPRDPRLHTAVLLRSPETLREQLLWLSALRRETDLLVPEPVPLPQGALVGRVSIEGVPERRHFALLRWVSGRNKREDLTPADLSLVGSFMARLHDHAERYRAPDPSVLPRWGWHWPFGESAPLWSEGEAFYSAEQMAVFEEAARRVRRDLEELGYRSEVFGLIHRDLNFSNVVFRENDVGAIDFDLCGLGHYLLDIVTVLGALRPLHTNRIDLMREALLEGYERERTLHPAHQEYFKTFAVMRRVAAINRDLDLLASPVTRHEARGHRFLQNTVTWLQRNYL